MNTESLRTIDDVIGITVFLLLAVAVVMSQARAGLPKDDILEPDWARRLPSVSMPVSDDRRLSGEFSEIMRDAAAPEIRLDGDRELLQPGGTRKTAIAIPE